MGGSATAVADMCHHGVERGVERDQWKTFLPQFVATLAVRQDPAKPKPTVKGKWNTNNTDDEK